MNKRNIYQLKILLRDIEPPIWRRIQVPGNISLMDLHFILQIAMGWTDSHLHEYQIAGERYGMHFDRGWHDEDLKSETRYRLDEVMPARGERFSYLYDFGDSWEHNIEVEEILTPAQKVVSPRCLAGARSCPPENVGGSRGYEEFLEVLNDSNHENHDWYLTWIGGNYQPEKFDLDQTDRDVRDYQLSDMMRIYNRHFTGRIGPDLKLYRSVGKWVDDLSAENHDLLEKMALRRDAVSLLNYLRDHPTRGTQSTGNLPLKAVRDVAALFVVPPVLDQKIGGREFKLRSESEVWPLVFIHTLLEVGGLIKGGKGKKIRVTRKGNQFYRAAPALQVWFLLETWWYHFNWLIAYRLEWLEELPEDFNYITLQVLISQPAEVPFKFNEFVERIVNQAWRIQLSDENDYVQSSLRWCIHRMVVDIMKDFQMVETDQPARQSRHRWLEDRIHTFRLTRLGMGLLKVLAGGLE